MKDYLENRIQELKEKLVKAERYGMHYWRYAAQMEELEAALTYLNQLKEDSVTR